MALKGDTSNLLLADIFQTLFQNGQSGVLHLRCADSERRVLFSPHGVTLIDALAFRAKRLGSLFVSGGLVAPEIIERATAEIGTEGKEAFSSVKLLVVLDDDGHLSLQHGVAVLRMEVREELFEVFTLDRMEFEFLEDDVPVEGIPRECYFRPEEVVMEAARRVDEWSRIREVVGLGDRYYVAGPDAAGEDAEAVITRLDGSHTTIDIAEELLVSRFEVARVVWQLLEANRLRPATVDELLRAARTLDPANARHRIEKILRRAAEMLDESDPRIDDAAQTAVTAQIRALGVELLVRRSRALLKAGHTEAAHTEALRAREWAPEDRGVLETLAEIHRARGDRDNEVKILTVLAERSAAEKRFDAAYEFAARVGVLMPDSPLLDHAFVVYCQNANRVPAGVEVLARAAGLRSTKPGVAQLYRAILALDPLRSDVRKMLARLESRRLKGRMVVIGALVLLIPAVGLFAKKVMSSFDEARRSGQIEAAQRMIDEGEWKAARTTLDALLLQPLDPASKGTVERLAKTAAEKLAEIDEQKKSRALHDTREDLSEVQQAIDERRFGEALALLRSSFDAPAGDAGSDSMIAAKRKVLTQAIEEESARLEAKQRRFSEPEEDSAIAAALTEFGADFGADRAAEFERLAAESNAIADSGNWAGLAPRIRAATARGQSVIAAMRPRVLELEARRDRNSELALLSDDYERILDDERAGRFAEAVLGYDRLMREYGDGNLAGYFEKRRANASTIATGLAEVQELSARGDAETAAERAAKLFTSVEDFDLAKLVGSPHRIETQPEGAEAIVDGKSIGRTPLVVHIRSDAPIEVVLRATGHRDTPHRLAYDSPSRIAIDLPRECRFITDLGAAVDVAPTCSARHIFVGARDGVVYRLLRSDGARDGEYRSKSLAGISVPPIVAGGVVVLAFGEGFVVGLDVERFEERWSATLDSRLVGAPIVDGTILSCATERGAIVTIDAATGDVRTIGSVETMIRVGPARIGDSLAVAAVNGETIAVSSRDGAIVFRTPAGAAPPTGIVAVGNAFVVVRDDGVIEAHSASSGESIWRIESGAASAAAPALHDGLLVLAVGANARVLDAASGASRGDVAVSDWISATPALSGGRLYICDRKGSLDVFDLTTKNRVFRHPLGAPSLAPPIVLPEGVLVVTGAGQVSLVGS